MNHVTIPLDDTRYPPLLRYTKRPPAAIHVRGDLACLSAKCVAVIGTRQASASGKRIAFNLAARLAREGYCVVSGLAVGIDGEAHSGALAAGGRTLAVLAHGLGAPVYPRGHQQLSKDIVGSDGALVTEYPFDAKPDQGTFVDRDRIQSGLSMAVIMIESGARGGSFHTLGFAKEQAREIVAIWSDATDFKRTGAERARDEFGAKIARTMEDVLVALRTVVEIYEKVGPSPQLSLL